jgi:hypothetical protein
MNTSPAPDPKLVKRTNEIAGKVRSMLPKRFGFIVMIFPFGTGESNMISQARLMTTLTLQDWAREGGQGTR